MINLFECKIRYSKLDEKSGKESKLSENYLIDAVDFIDAQARIYKEIQSRTNGDFELQSIKRTSYSEIIDLASDNIIWYKAKISFVTFDEKSGKEKRSSFNLLVTGSNVEEANKNIIDAFKETISDYTIEGITDSKLTDYLKIEN